VLRYPHFQQLYRMTEADLLEYVQFLQSISNLVMLDPYYRAPFLRDANDTHVLQTAEQGQADIICTHDRDFYDQAVRLFCLSRGIEICNEASLWNRLKTH
jgi:putative PIN family toxin of toxin-antitoxin system